MTIELFETIGTLFFGAVAVFMFVVMPRIDWYKICNKQDKTEADELTAAKEPTKGE